MRINTIIENDSNIYELLVTRFGIVGQSKAMQQVIQKLMQAAPTDLTILITGETGTGKEVFANAAHGLSLRRSQPFVSVNCGAIPETLLESELFGHERGAFTGAIDQRKGFFEVANKGTIFLDEIGEMPYGTQVKLLRILESGEFSRLGSSANQKIDVRIIAATNRELGRDVQQGNFRQDLYFRLQSVQLPLPSLRSRPEDIPELAAYFAEKVAEKLKIELRGISPGAINILKTLPWPGNVRELKNLIDTIVTLEKAEFITPEMLRRYIPPALPPPSNEPLAREISMVPYPKKDENSSFELGLIFRTMLELQNEVADIKFLLHNSLAEIQKIREEISLFTYSTVTEEPSRQPPASEDLNIADMERKLIIQALRQHAGNRRMASKALGISERTLYRKITDYDIID